MKTFKITSILLISNQNYLLAKQMYFAISSQMPYDNISLTMGMKQGLQKHSETPTEILK